MDIAKGKHSEAEIIGALKQLEAGRLDSDGFRDGCQCGFSLSSSRETSNRN
jgi:hypothetical protein